LGWVTLNAGGGHPGNDARTCGHPALDRAAGRQTDRPTGGWSIRRTRGTACDAALVSDRQGLAAEWAAKNGNDRDTVGPLDVLAGEAIDLVTDCRDNPNFDGFRWTVTIRLEPADGSSPRTWDSAAEFGGPAPESFDRWQRLAHVLLLTNEFAFID
jgi:hypothetical protein